MSDLLLRDNAKVAVIGGGPSGAFFSIFALKMAKMVGRSLDITIFEPKDFSADGPKGCNHCGGVISEHLVQTLAVEGINIPPEVVQRSIDSYVLHTQCGDVFIKSPAAEKRIATVYRGGGPKGRRLEGGKSFDRFLLDCAVAEGAVHQPLRIDGIRLNGKPVLSSGGNEVMEADLVVGAFGVNSAAWKIFESLGIGYKKPDTTSAFITELELGHDVVSGRFGNTIHFFLVPRPGNIKFAALIPKGDFVTLCILGRGIDQETVSALLRTPAARALLPEDILEGRHCRCFPKLSLDAATEGFADRVVIIGDAGSTRLFKDGIGASYIMAKAAAKVALFHGVSREDFREHYLPVYNGTKVDNRFGKIVYKITDAFKNVSLLTDAMIHLVGREQQYRDEKLRILSSILWDTFTGNETYRNIFFRGASVRMNMALLGEIFKAVPRRLT